jgi:hypothetical protein
VSVCDPDERAGTPQDRGEIDEVVRCSTSRSVRNNKPLDGTERPSRFDHGQAHSALETPETVV